MTERAPRTPFGVWSVSVDISGAVHWNEIEAYDSEVEAFDAALRLNKLNPGDNCFYTVFHPDNQTS